MGSYCALSLNGYEIDQSGSYINKFWSCLFNEDDKRSQLAPYDLYFIKPIADNNQVPTYEYAASAETMKMRLEILGYTLDKVKSEYVTRLNNAVLMKQKSNSESSEPYKVRDEKHLTSLSIGGFEYWLHLIKYIFDNKINIYSNGLAEEDEIYRFILDYNDYDEDLYLGYPNIGIGYFLRGALEVVDPYSELILDITSLVDSGYYEADEAVCTSTAQAHIDSTLEFQKIIILTEGSSDSSILSKALKLLYPKVESYFSFLDFDSYKAEGGAAMLEKTVKSFAAAGINNKIIALFDYDAAGMVATARLKKRKLPDNIRVITLPQINIATNYPTNGPQGKTNENVNGRACSIEMYLGVDVLTDASGQLAPVEWRSLEPQINTYQGEISGKAELQKKFQQKTSITTKKGSIQPEHDWSGLRLVFESIFKASSTIGNSKTS